MVLYFTLVGVIIHSQKVTFLQYSNTWFIMMLCPNYFWAIVSPNHVLNEGKGEENRVIYGLFIKLIPMKLSEPGFEEYGSCHSLMQVSSSLAAHLKRRASV